jgi:hypothetical protein
MKFTNNFNLPASLVDALINDDYDFKKLPNVFSVTEVISPPKKTILSKRHDDEIEADVSERVWTMTGSAIHNVLEHATKGGERLREERWYLNLRNWEIHTLGRGQKVVAQKWYNDKDTFLTGKLDCYDAEAKDLQDYKITSVWSFLLEKEEAKPEWVAQCNMNTLAIRLIGFEVERCTIIGILKDWSKTAFRRGDYGDKFPIPFAVIKLPLWDNNYTKAFIECATGKHVDAEKLADDAIPVCAPEERWAKPTVYAVMKDGRKTSLRNHETKEQAEIHLSQCGDGHRIEVRKGVDTRCVDYCDAAPFCNYYKATYSKKNGAPNEQV